MTESKTNTKQLSENILAIEQIETDESFIYIHDDGNDFTMTRVASVDHADGNPEAIALGVMMSESPRMLKVLEKLIDVTSRVYKEEELNEVVNKALAVVKDATRVSPYPEQWSGHQFECGVCGRTSRISREAMHAMVENGRFSTGEDVTEDMAAEMFEICLRCLTGKRHYGKLTPTGEFVPEHVAESLDNYMDADECPPKFR